MRGRKHKTSVSQAEIFHSSSQEADCDTKEVKKTPQLKDFALTPNQCLMIMSKLPKMFSLQPAKSIQKSRKLLLEIIDKPSQCEDSEKKQQEKQSKNMLSREASKMTIKSNQSMELDEQPSIVTYNAHQPGISQPIFSQQKLAYYNTKKTNQQQEPPQANNQVISRSYVAFLQNQSQYISEYENKVQVSPIQQTLGYKKQERQQGGVENVQQIMTVRPKRGRKSRLISIDSSQRQPNQSTSKEQKSKQKQALPQTASKTRQQQAYRQIFELEFHILKTLKQHPQIQPFILPVDELRDCAPNYLSIIKKPMDVSTIEDKLKNHVYQNCNQFHTDVEQMWKNSHIYNRPKSMMTKLTFQLQKLYENLKKANRANKEGIENKRGRRI